MEPFRIYNDVTEVEETFKVAGQSVSKPVAFIFLGYLGAVFLGAVIMSTTGSFIPLILIGVVGGTLVLTLLILDQRLRSYGLRNVMVQARLLYTAAKDPMSRNY